ncbi:putative NADH-flavin reductase [Flavobacterium arsenatis]|uniref:NADH-flavin reductase n=1 Tax=Flavobacterium arsenatis TaxID=1484332 RepID=A0ABU1TMT9_9FLAO|nr:SDR family oxidoreductase [Flavobacterium arsenatis]MDR6967275.1 putative NADH-flavin reductase [Flavobacterium arsenatis]
MKIIVFGATGSVGKEIVKQALVNGYQVKAFVRDPKKIAHLSHPNLNVFEGDVLNPKNVEAAMQNQEVVLCAIGDGRAGKVRAEGTKNIINAANKLGIKRLVCQTTLGLGSSQGNLNFVWKYIMFGFFLKKAFKDHQLQEDHLFNCSLNYTIVRPSALTDGTITNNYKIGFDGKYNDLTLKISREDVASFMLEQIDKTDYLKKAVSISN